LTLPKDLNVRRILLLDLGLNLIVLGVAGALGLRLQGSFLLLFLLV
jgi:hypothetical protein